MSGQRRYAPDDRALEETLMELAEEVRYPPTPDLAATVRRRLELEEPHRLRTPFRTRRLTLRAAAIAIAALLVVAGTVGALGLALGGLRFVWVPVLPTASPGAPESSSPAATGADSPQEEGRALGLGAPVSIADARASVSFAVLVPAVPELAAPDAVFLARAPSGGQVALVYAPRPGLPPIDGDGPGLVITQFAGDTNRTLVEKLIVPGTTVEPVPVAGTLGYWISGEPHAILYRPDPDAEVEQAMRLARDTLVWHSGGVVYRLESALGRERAVEIAESLREAEP